MTLIVLPDVVQLVTSFLRAQSELQTLVDDRVYSIIPAERTYPLLLCAQVADSPLTTSPWWATAADVQLSGYAAHSNDARLVVETARALLAQRAMTTHAEGTVSWVTFLNMSFLPDAAVVGLEGRPLPRWVTTATLTVHPNP